MSWCDKLASTPAVGVKLSTRLTPGDFILQSLSPHLSSLVNGEPSKIIVEDHKTFGIVVVTQDGFRYGVDAQKVHVAFQHRLRAIAVSGGPPVMEMLSRPLPYTKLLPETSSRLSDVVMNLPDVTSRKLERVGIVSLTNVDGEDLPPGIKRFVDYMSAPWGGDTEHFSMSISSVIQRTDKWIDRCIHTVTKPEEQDQLMTLNFDWQRIFADAKPVNEQTVRQELKHASAAAMEYFESIAEGAMFDEQFSPRS